METAFFIHTGCQSTGVNKMLRAADLCDGAVIRDGSGFEVSVQWKDGEKVASLRIEKVRQNLRRAFEAMGYCVLEIITGRQ